MKKIIYAIVILLSISLAFAEVCKEPVHTPTSSDSGSNSGGGSAHIWGATLSNHCYYDWNITNSSGIYYYNKYNTSINFTTNPFGFEVCEVLG